MLLPSLILGLLAAAPQQIGIGQSVRLPRFGAGAADHATLAVNALGDICIAYQSKVGGGNQRLVETVLLRNVQGGLWETDPGLHLLLGDPALALYGVNRDSCNKPAVTALDDGSFVVAWPRQDMLNKTVGQLELARIEIRDAQDQFLPAPLVHTAAPGLGHLADPLIAFGDAGVMPDLAPLAGGDCAVVYAHEESKVVAWNWDVHRDYAIRLARVNWSQGPGSPTFLDGPYVLATGVPYDNHAGNGFSGGLVLPELATDDFDNLIAAWEQYRVKYRPGWSGEDLGEIALRRYDAFGSATPLAPLDELSFHSYFQSNSQRRPSLSASRLDAANGALLSWGNIDNRGYFNDKVGFREVFFGAAGQATVEERFWNFDPAHDDRHPVVARTELHQRCFATREFTNKRVILASVHASQSMFQVPSLVKWPERPAAEVFETVNQAGAPMELLMITYEGAAYNDPNAYRTYFGIYQL